MSEHSHLLDASRTPSGWAVAAADGRLLSVDARFAELAGVERPSALLGQRWSDLVGAGSSPELDEALRAIAAGEAWRGTLELAAGATPARVELAISVAPSPPGSPSGSVVVLRAMQPARLANDEAVDPLARVVTLEAVAESPSAEAAARSVLQELQHAVAFDWAAVLRLGVDGVEVVAAYPSPMAGLASGRSWSPPSAAERALLASGSPSLSGRMAQPHGPGTDDEGSPLGRLAAFGFQSSLRVPLYAGDEVVGYVTLFHRAIGAFGPEDGLSVEQLVRPLGRRLAEAEPPSIAPSGEQLPLAPLDDHEGEPDAPAREAPVIVPVPEPEPAPEADEEIEPEPSAGVAEGVREALADPERLGPIGDFAAGLAHELNSPLTAIAGYAQMLPSLPDEQRTVALDTIEREALRLGRIVQNLLYFARQQPPRSERVDLNGLLRRIAEVRREELSSGGVQLDLRLGTVPSVRGDEYQLEQVFLNLVSNAAAALRPGGGRVTVTSVATGEVAQVTLSDSGPGIAPEWLERVFDPFFTTREVGEGAGLGLSIAYGIVSEHGGRLWAESPAGGGGALRGGVAARACGDRGGRTGARAILRRGAADARGHASPAGRDRRPADAVAARQDPRRGGLRDDHGGILGEGIRRGRRARRRARDRRAGRRRARAAAQRGGAVAGGGAAGTTHRGPRRGAAGGRRRGCAGQPVAQAVRRGGVAGDGGAGARVGVPGSSPLRAERASRLAGGVQGSEAASSSA